MTMIKDLATHKETHVTAVELAEYWRVCVRTVYYQVEKGALRATRVGRQLRIRTDDARAYGRIEDPVTAPVSSVPATRRVCK
ncbi:MAG: helix-turn-helix domain-containing protein [Acidobacteria bacterium]|nr:helix-turn-helix domain-containing protein [Acidobacteriota bacterium]